MAEPLGLHPLSIEDCLDEEQIPKIDLFETNSFILVNKFTYMDDSLFIDEVNLFIGGKFILVSVRDPHYGERFIDFLKSFPRKNLNPGEANDLYLKTIIDYIVDDKFKVIDDIGERLNDIEETIINNTNNFVPASLISIRHDILKLRKSIVYERELVFKICRGDSKFISGGMIPHFRDIYDHLSKLYEELEIHREMTSGFLEIYRSMMNYNISLNADRTNRVIRRLTLITTIFMPLTFFTGMFGMSEWSMMTGPDRWRITYPVFLLLMVIIALINYFILKRAGRKK
jgi:magnesium transporter